MSAIRYIISVRTTNGDRKLEFKLKTVAGNKEDFIQEIKNYTDWDRIFDSLEKTKNNDDDIKFEMLFDTEEEAKEWVAQNEKV